MTLITETEALRALCTRLATAEFVTVDTEFMRERTYWARLCLVQLGGPDEAAAIDTLAEGIDLTPLFELMANPGVVKVFHAARQDIEIFHYLTGDLPTPVFDTQIAAMVCGFGDAAGYETLATKLASARIDKTMRFTDWARRPLSERQITYALSDVTHLRIVYQKLRDRIEREGRGEWVREENAQLANPAIYRTEPEDAWKRIKTRNQNPRFLAVLREVAAWRETAAQTRDIPRNRLVRDEALIEIAAHAPSNADELARTRGLARNFAQGKEGAAILDAVARGNDVSAADSPEPKARPPLPRGLGPMVDLLRVLLKMKCDEHNVAPKLIASAADLEAIAADDTAPVAALSGWRRQVFGEDALALKHGNLALAANGKRVRLVPVGAVPAG